MNRLPRASLHVKLAIAFAAALLPLLALMLWGFRADVHRSERGVLDSQLLAAEAVALQVEETFDAALAVAWAVANDPLTQTLEPQQLDAHLGRLLGLNPVFETIAVFGANGQNRGWASQAESDEPRPDISDRKYFQTVMGTNGPAISEVLQLRKSAGGAGVVVAVPLRNGADQATGAVIVIMPTVQLSKWYEESRLRPGQAVFLADRAGRLAFYSSIRHLTPKQADAFLDSVPLRRALSGTSQTVARFQSPLLKDERIGAFVPTPKYHWAVGVTVPRSIALEPVNTALKRQLMGVLGTFLLSGLIATLIARQLTSPLSRLRTYAQAIGRGNLSQRVSVKTGDEFEELGDAFNEMAQQIETRDAHLRANEERFRATFEQAAVGIAHTTVDGYWLWVNDTLCEILGYPRDELVQHTLQEITHPEDVARDLTAVQELLSGRFPRYALEKRYRRANGSYIWVASTLALVRDPDGEPAYFIAVVEDIQRRKQMEEDRRDLLQREQLARASAEAASRAKDHLLATVSHELRTPLTPALAALDLLKEDTALSTQSQSFLKMIRSNIEMEARLVGDLVDLTRIRQAKLSLWREPVDAHEALQHVLKYFRKDADAKGLELTSSFAAEEHTVLADPARLQQIFWNLLSNAVKYTPAGGQVFVQTSSEADLLKVTFKDTGIGIEPELMSRLFNAFEQGEQTLTRRYGGLGLGLAISRSLVEMHGGKLTVFSEGANKGSAFTAEFPLAKAPAAGTPAAAPPSEKPAAEKRRRILLVEDNPDTQQILTKLLQRSGHSVTTASSAREALEAAQDDSLDLLLTDIGLPDASGWQLLQELRKTCPVRAIAISGFGTPEDREKSREAGFMQHLVKPISYQVLKETIDEVCDGKD